MSLLSSCTSSCALAASAAETNGAGEFKVEVGAALASTVISSRTSSSSSDSLRVMMLPSSGSSRRLWLRSPKSLRANSSSHEVSGRTFSSWPKEGSTTGIPPEGPLLVPYRPDTPVYRLEVKTRSRAYYHVLPHVPQRRTLPPCRGGLWCHHMSCGSRPHHPVEDGSGATMCPAAPDPTTLLRRAPVPSRVHQL
jgi:hypothetical protein